MADWGIKISLPQNDVGTADDLQLALTSALGYPKIDKNADPAHFTVDSYTFESNPGLGVTNLVSIAHGYTYTPASNTLVNVTRTIGGSNIRTYYMMAPHLLLLGGFGGLDAIEAYCDDEFFKIDIYRTADAFTSVPIVDMTGEVMTYKYAIFAENGT